MLTQESSLCGLSLTGSGRHATPTPLRHNRRDTPACRAHCDTTAQAQAPLRHKGQDTPARPTTCVRTGMDLDAIATQTTRHTRASRTLRHNGTGTSTIATQRHEWAGTHPPHPILRLHNAPGQRHCVTKARHAPTAQTHCDTNDKTHPRVAHTASQRQYTRPRDRTETPLNHVTSPTDTPPHPTARDAGHPSPKASRNLSTAALARASVPRSVGR